MRNVLPFLSGLLLFGCTAVNQPLDAVNVPVHQRARNHTPAATFAEMVPLPSDRGIQLDPIDVKEPVPPLSAPALEDRDGYFVGIAISGGGSRSANFSAACFFQLQRLGFLRHADYISTVSGGSLTGAYYCTATDEQWNPQQVQQRLTHPFATDIIVRTIIPWNLLLLWATDWDRSDLLADSLQRELFTRDGKGLTFADLRPDRPRLLINATDLQSGKRFVFCNESFDELNSDLARYPIGYAVAASAAFPVLMHHVTLRDYSTAFEQYRHLIDGGVTDNLGIQSLVETYLAHVKSARRAGRPNPYPYGAILLAIDARTDFDASLSDKGDIGLIESLKAGAGLTSTALVARVSSATMEEIILEHSPDHITAKQIREQIRTLKDSGYVELQAQSGEPVRVLHLSLSRVNELTNLPFLSFHERVNSIATYFNIDPTEAYHLYQAAELLIEEKFEPQLRKLVTELESPRPEIPN